MGHWALVEFGEWLQPTPEWCSQNLEAIALHITLHNFDKGDRTTHLQALNKVTFFNS
ncbi:hypothetical protein [Nostoc linckia]|jgi:hypothetical protein|uniref:hypothetical protein n=1 Tax=Nostoc linckia TaxID=92942 RepID=UPI0015D4A405|nr:hypothetical protein [Nostoc linckia]